LATPGGTVKAIIAVFQSKYVDTETREVSLFPEEEVNVTCRFLELPLLEIHRFEDESDVAQGLVLHLNKDGVAGLRVKESAAAYFGVDDLAALTQELLDSARSMLKSPSLTNEEYAAGDDDRVCPYCGSEQVEIIYEYSLEEVGDFAGVRVRCEECKAKWEDDYKITNYAILNEPQDSSLDWMNHEELVASQGETCPFCRSDEGLRSSYGESGYEGKEAALVLHCDECEADYGICFRVVGYSQP
jgi:RNA polymerase subunit RPABC4/transcription elongation factor Spt4